jgi:hypothetical protein
MNSQEISTINKIYKSVLLNGSKYYKNAMKDESIKSARFLESFSIHLGEMNDKLSVLLNLTDKYAIKCLEKAAEIRKKIELTKKYENDPSHMFLAHKELYKDMSWADMSDKEDQTNKTLADVENLLVKKINKNEYTHKAIVYKKINAVYNINIGFSYKIPIINKLTEIPATFYWFNGDKNYSEGVYTCLSNGFYIKVPFPNLIDTTNSYNKTGSIKCKNSTYKECLKIRKELSVKYNSNVRECTFAHKNDKYIKIGTSVRCPNMPHFGTHNSLINDLKNVQNDDVKTMLMYSLSDMLLASLQYQKKEKTTKNTILTNIDIC